MLVNIRAKDVPPVIRKTAEEPSSMTVAIPQGEMAMAPAPQSMQLQTA
ncbi:MAG: hypothetical protein ACTHJV_00895 [Rhizobiaceae bacterium]